MILRAELEPVVDDLDFALLFVAEFRLGDLPSEAAGDDTKCRE